MWRPERKITKESQAPLRRSIFWLRSPRGKTRRERLQAALRSSCTNAAASSLGNFGTALPEFQRVILYGRSPTEPRTPTIGFTVNGIFLCEVAQRLADAAVFVSDGDFYATTVVERLGLANDGLVRPGCACYTTEEEVERLIDGVRRIARG